MNIQITSRKFRAKDSLNNFIKDEVQGLSKFNSEIMDANVVLSFLHSNNSIKSAEIVVHVPGKVFKADENSDDFRKSVSMASEKIARQLKKLKTRRLAKKR